MQHVKSAFTIAALALAAHAQTPIGPFVGHEQEDFSGPQQATLSACLQYRVFDDTADVCTPGFMGCFTVDMDFFNCLMTARSAPYFFFSVDGAVEITFDYEVQRFGGYFGTNQFFPDATVDFLDINGALIASVMATFPANCTWNWQGWDLGANSIVRKVRIAGTPVFNEGFVDMDDLEVDYVFNPPQAYCTAGTTTNGCSASISSSGTASASATSGFVISVAGVEGQKQGLLFYGVSGKVASPWGPSTSFLCVKSPTQRMSPNFSGGVATACNGVLAEDWLAWIAAHPTTLGAPLSVGQHVQAQAWFRDPPSPKTTNLSNALEFMVGP